MPAASKAPNRLTRLAVLLAILAAAAWLTWQFAPIRRGSTRGTAATTTDPAAGPLDPHYEPLAKATTPAEIRAALQTLANIDDSLGPLPPDLARKAFQFVGDLPLEKGPDDDSLDDDCAAVAHLAALAGDADLLRKMVRTYFGESEDQNKGGYIEEFLQEDADAFFEMPDALELWDLAGGAAECAADPENTFPILRDYASRNHQARKMWDEAVDTSARDTTDWGATARKITGEPLRPPLSPEEKVAGTQPGPAG